MAFIKSRKHALAPQALASTGSAVAALVSLAMPVAAQTQPAAGADKPQQQLPPVRVQSTPLNDYKAEAVDSLKFTQPLVDTPQTVIVIKKEILQQQVATTLAEALRNTPGITLQLGENGNTTTGDSIFMRGFDTTNSIFVDGIRDLGNISRDVFNIEQIEVVKGPAGSDNGRGASSGYVNLVSKFANLDKFAFGSVSLGDAKRVRATADVNRPLDLGIPGSALRLNLVAQDYGVPGRDEVEQKRFGFAPSLAFGLNTPTRTFINYLYVDQKNRPDGGVSTYGLPGYANAQGPKVDPTNYYGALTDFDDVTLNMVTVRIEHNFSPTTVLRNTARLGATEQDYLLTGVNAVNFNTANPDASTVVRSRQGRHQTNEIVTNQTNLSTEFMTGTVKHSLSTGVELIHEGQRQDNAQTLTDTTLPASLQQPLANLYHPNTGDTFLTPPFKGAYTKGSTLTGAFYVFDTLHFGESFLVNGGLRWEKYRTQTNSSTFTAESATAPESLVQNPPMSLTDTLTSWKLGAVYKPAANGSVYATISTSFQPPGGANFSLSAVPGNQANAAYEPQEGSNFEIGTKWDLLGGNLAATAAIFRAENKNEIINDATTGGVPQAVGERRVEGVEFGVVGQVTPELNLSAGLAYMDPKIVRGSAANQGGVIVYSPKLTFSSWATYRLGAFLLGGGARYVDTVARTSNVAVQPNLTETEPYWVVDAMLGYEINKNLNLQLNVYNLFDNDYVALVNNGGSRYIPGQPRNALLTLNLSY